MLDPVKLYDHSQASNPRRVRIFAAEEGIELSPEEVNILAGQSLTPEFLAKSSSGGVPVRHRSRRPISPPHSAPARSSESRWSSDHCSPNLAYRSWLAAFDHSSYVIAFALACLLLPTLIAAPAAHAVCRSPKNICKHIGDCLNRTADSNNNDVVRIREGVRMHNGKMVWAGADACAIDLGIKRQWDKWSDGCSDVEYVTIAKAEIENGKTLCDRYSQ
jgi:hypothetical protein